jgi:hypothetical protein
MMTKHDVSAPERADAVVSSIGSAKPGQGAMAELLEAQSAVPSRSPIARFFGLSPLSPETHLLYRGVVGELEVGEALDRLGSEWVVIHALPIDEGLTDIDHLVIGPAGVFIVSTQNHSGLNVWASQRTLMVGGIRQPTIRSMEFEMGKVERILGAATGAQVEVSGILAVVAAKTLVVRERHRDVAVLASNHVVSWLLRRQRSLSPEQIARIGAAASLAATWNRPESVDAKPAAVRAQFERLRSEVRQAWRIQLSWVIGTSALVVGTFAVITYSILLNALGTTGI